MNNSSEHLFLFFFKISDLIIFFQNVITGAHIHRSPFLSLTYTSQDPINNGYREPRPRSTLFSITCPQFLFENLLHSDVIQHRKYLFILLFHSDFKCPSVRTYLDSILGVNLNVILLSWSSLIHQYFGCCQIYSHCWTTARSDKLIMVIYLDWIFHFIAGPFTAFILLLEVFWTTHNLWWWIIVHKKVGKFFLKRSGDFWYSMSSFLFKLVPENTSERGRRCLSFHGYMFVFSSSYSHVRFI